jgi:hypothetical protein
MKSFTLLIVINTVFFVHTIIGNQSSEFSQQLADKLVQNNKEQTYFLKKTDTLIKNRVTTAQKDLDVWLEIEKTAALISQNAENMVQQAEKRIQELVKIK